MNLTANDFSGSHHRGEIAGSKSFGADSGIIRIVIKKRPPDGGRSESITQSYSGAAWILFLIPVSDSPTHFVQCIMGESALGTLDPVNDRSSPSAVPAQPVIVQGQSRLLTSQSKDYLSSEIIRSPRHARKYETL